MKISAEWLASYFGSSRPSSSDLVAALELAGIEVEGLIEPVKLDPTIIAGVVEEVVRHPNADRLKIVRVNTGKDILTIVCGAPNVREGIKVAVALRGSVLPNGTVIGEASLRGVKSEGMLCSSLELSIGDDGDGILELPTDTELGAEVSSVVANAMIIDIKTAANRSDLLSMDGLARDVAAFLPRAKLSLAGDLEIKQSENKLVGETNHSAVRRYMLAQIELPDMTSSALPGHTARRLTSSGIRSISPIVDMTNYVMLQTGQPLHAFDAAKVKLPVGVRYAKVGESITTIDGVARRLSDEDLVVCDAEGPIALAGIMGGKRTEVDSKTKAILLEAAVFDETSVRKSARRHRMRSEASIRFERGLACKLPEIGIARAIAITTDYLLGKTTALTDITNVTDQPRALELGMPQLVKLLGYSLSPEEAVESLRRLDMDVRVEGESLVLDRVPWWRRDLHLPEDLIEEVARVQGYDKVASQLPPWRPRMFIIDTMRAKRRRISEIMYAVGAFQVMTYSFVSYDQLTLVNDDAGQYLKLKNPLTNEQAYMRRSTLPSHLVVLHKNRKYAQKVAFYETTNVFLPAGEKELPVEKEVLAATVMQKSGAAWHLKGVLDALARELNLDLDVVPDNWPPYAPGKSASIRLGSRTIGQLGVIDLRISHQLKILGEVAHMEVDLKSLLDGAEQKRYTKVSRFPAIKRDITIEVPDSLTWREISRALDGYLVEYVGEYRGQEIAVGHKHLTVRLTVVGSSKTPTEDQANDEEKRLLQSLHELLKAR